METIEVTIHHRSVTHGSRHPRPSRKAGLFEDKWGHNSHSNCDARFGFKYSRRKAGLYSKHAKSQFIAEL